MSEPDVFERVHVKTPLGDPKKPSFKQLKQIVATIAPKNFNPDLNAVQRMYRDALAEFVGKWLYTDTSGADFSLSVLNRHYVLHGLEPGNFYRPEDTHRLLLAYDLLIDVVSMSHGIYYAMVPDEAIEYSQRNDYYALLAAGVPNVAVSQLIERSLLSQHQKYIPAAI